MDSIVIVGGSGGIGRAIGARLEAEYNVISMSRAHRGTPFYHIPYDVLDRNNVEEAWESLAYTPIKALIYASGYVRPANIIESSLEDLDNTIAINLSGAIEATQRFLRHSVKDKIIIYIASTAGTRPQPGWSIYASAKAGLINFAQTLGEELKYYGTRVYCISPGRCATELRRILAPEEDQTKIMQPSEVAEVVYSLMKEPGLLTRQNILVRG